MWIQTDYSCHPPWTSKGTNSSETPFKSTTGIKREIFSSVLSFKKKSRCTVSNIVVLNPSHSLKRLHWICFDEESQVFNLWYCSENCSYYWLVHISLILLRWSHCNLNLISLMCNSVYTLFSGLLFGLAFACAHYTAILWIVLKEVLK